MDVKLYFCPVIENKIENFENKKFKRRCSGRWQYLAGNWLFADELGRQFEPDQDNSGTNCQWAWVQNRIVDYTSGTDVDHY